MLINLALDWQIGQDWLIDYLFKINCHVYFPFLTDHINKGEQYAQTSKFTAIYAKISIYSFTWQSLTHLTSVASMLVIILNIK